MSPEFNGEVDLEMKIFGIISMVLFAVCFIPQIMRTYRTRIVSGISPVLWIMVVFGHLTGLIYTLYLKDGILVASYSIGLVLSSIVLAGYYRYR